jgi:ribosomal protein S16
VHAVCRSFDPGIAPCRPDRAQLATAVRDHACAYQLMLCGAQHRHGGPQSVGQWEPKEHRTDNRRAPRLRPAQAAHHSSVGADLSDGRLD